MNRKLLQYPVSDCFGFTRSVQTIDTYRAWRENPKAREIGVLGTESLLDGLIVVGVLKEVFRRDHPARENLAIFGTEKLHSPQLPN